METECVKVVSNGDVMGRTVPLNGCIKCVSTIDHNSADDDCRGNNNMTETVTLINSACKFDRSDCSIADDGSRSQVQVCKQKNIDNDSCCQSGFIDECDTPVLSVSAEQSVGTTTACNSGSRAALPVEELNRDLSQLAVAETNTDLSKVPSDQAVSEGLGGCVQYVVYESERQMEDIMRLITKDLSEPYSIYTYRYFIHNWPRLCYLAMDSEKCVGAIVCKLDKHRSGTKRGYIAMLAVDQDYRRGGIGSSLVVHAIKSMIDPVNGGCDEVVLETEISNSAALRLYEKLGFVRDKRLFRYYLNGVDALRLKLWLK